MGDKERQEPNKSFQARLGLLAAFGEKTKRKADEAAAVLAKLTINPPDRNRFFEVLAKAMEGLEDQDAASVVEGFGSWIGRNPLAEPAQLGELLDAHVDPKTGFNAALAADCLAVVPPEQVRVLRRLPQSGSQKAVYEGTWAATSRPVMLKRFLDQETEARLLVRELQPHPLSMEHPNIIETHLFQNKDGQPFLVEKRLSHVLHDRWRTRGATEAVNLLHDVAAALHFLTDEGLIHGDVKPDNLGYEDHRYVLLDFGIARRAEEVTDDTTATGSIRTRAPELLLGSARQSTDSDLWALGASAFNALLGRFPLIEASRHIPPIGDPERSRLETELQGRVEKEWRKWVEDDLPQIEPPALRNLVEEMLAKDPIRRPSAEEVAKRCRLELASFLRRSERVAIPKEEELEQLDVYFPPDATLRTIPARKRTELLTKLKELQAAQSLDENQRAIAARLERRLGPPEQTDG